MTFSFIYLKSFFSCLCTPSLCSYKYLCCAVGVHPAPRALARRARGGRAERAGRRGPAGGRQPQAPAAQGAGARRAPAAPAAGPAR